MLPVFQILMCSVYGVCKVVERDIRFKAIVQEYRNLPTAQPDVCSSFDVLNENLCVCACAYMCLCVCRHMCMCPWGRAGHECFPTCRSLCMCVCLCILLVCCMSMHRLCVCVSDCVSERVCVYVCVHACIGYECSRVLAGIYKSYRCTLRD